MCCVIYGHEVGCALQPNFTVMESSIFETSLFFGNSAGAWKQ